MALSSIVFGGGKTQEMAWCRGSGVVDGCLVAEDGLLQVAKQEMQLTNLLGKYVCNLRNGWGLACEKYLLAGASLPQPQPWRRSLRKHMEFICSLYGFSPSSSKLLPPSFSFLYNHIKEEGETYNPIFCWRRKEG